MRNLTRFCTALASAAALTVSLSAAPVDSSELQALRDQVHTLEQQLRVLSRQLEIRDEAAAAAAPSAPKVTLNDKGFTLASADAANSIKLRGLVQLDSRFFFHDGGGVVNNAFVLRRARLITEGTFAKNYSFQLVPEFGGTGAASIVDANFGVAVDKSLQFKFGKFKVPVGLELLQSDSWTFFNERSIVTNLVPNRDLGVQVSGDVFDGTLNYTAGVFGGVGDGASTTNADFDNEKDVAARLWYSPFKNDGGSFLQGFSFGVAGTFGREKTAAARTGGYRTDGQQTFFSYSANTVGDGQNWRIAPQAEFRHGAFGAIGEYVLSTVNVRPSATGAKAELQNQGWQLGAGYVLTGEDSSYTGVTPRVNFDPVNGTWGAIEVVGRYSELRADDNAFPLFAAASTNANKATAFGAGLNWYISKTVVFKFDYYQTHFGFNAAAPAISASPILRQDEKSFITRFQLSF